jgi:thymidylate synthase (FAD)
MIELIYEPTVEIVGRQTVDRDAIGRFFQATGVEKWETDTAIGGELLIEFGGRLCYQSFATPRPGGHKAYIDHILEVGHGSVLEHAVFNIAISGVDRSFTHELVRHRAGTAFSQLSQRFVDESDCRFVVPMALADEVRAAKALMDREGSAAGPAIVLCDPDLHERIGLRWIECVEFCRDAYEVLSNRLYSKYADIPDKTLRRKRAREAARSVLPEATETRILFTANARALRHFCEMRGDIGADQQIRRVALKVLALMQAEMPQCFGDYALDRVAGQDVVSTPYRKT